MKLLDLQQGLDAHSQDRIVYLSGLVTIRNAAGSAACMPTCKYDVIAGLQAKVEKFASPNGCQPFLDVLLPSVAAA
jgi:hypothetical protein